MIEAFRRARFAMLALASLMISACVYRIDIAQGNLLDQDDVDLVTVGMAQSQVRFLLGTPMIRDPFHSDRWDYPYYYTLGREGTVAQRWVIIYFENDRVSNVVRNLALDPPD